MKKRRASYITNIITVSALYLIMFSLIANGTINSYNEGIIVTIGINIILAVSLNLTTGSLGELVLGHAGFMSIGAYTSALFTLKSELPAFVEFPLALILGGVVAAGFGIIIGIPALRLKGDYLAIITLGFGEIIRVIILNLNVTGGGRGLSGIDEYTSFNWVFWITIIVISVIFSFMRTRHGRAILSIRDNQIAAESVGIPTTYYKIHAFTLSSFCAGIAGGLYAHYITVLDPNTFGFNRSIEILVMVVLGGMGSFTGSILAAIVLTYLPELLRTFNDYRLLVYSITLILVMIFRPKGLFGKYEFSLYGWCIKMKKKLLNKKSPSEKGVS